MKFARLAFRDDVALLTLDSPAGNRINFEMRAELKEAVLSVRESSARSLLVQGEGSDFCLGGDVRDWPGVPLADLQPKIQVYAEALEILRNLPMPTIAAVQGGCMGGGFELALNCDLVVASRSASFAFPEARLGILTLQGGMLEVAQRLGQAKAAELIFLSEPTSAVELHRLNIVNRVVDDGDLGTVAFNLARRLAAGPTKAFAATKMLWKIQRESGAKVAYDSLYGISMPLFESDDARTALRNAAEAIATRQPFPTTTFAGK